MPKKDETLNGYKKKCEWGKLVQKAYENRLDKVGTFRQCSSDHVKADPHSWHVTYSKLEHLLNHTAIFLWVSVLLRILFQYKVKNNNDESKCSNIVDASRYFFYCCSSSTKSKRQKITEWCWWNNPRLQEVIIVVMEEASPRESVKNSTSCEEAVWVEWWGWFNPVYAARWV